MNSPDGTTTGKVTVKPALQLLSVVTVIEPMNFSPSPKPEASHKELEKSWSVKVVLGVLSKVPWTLVPALEIETEVSRGKFCKPLGPASPSQVSFGVTPSLARSMPKPPLEKIELERIRPEPIFI